MSVIIWIPSWRRWITSGGLTRWRPMMSTRMTWRAIPMPRMRWPRVLRSWMSTLQKRIQSRCTRWRNTWSGILGSRRPLRPIIVGRGWVCMLIRRLLSNWIIVRIRFTSGRLTVGRPTPGWWRPHGRRPRSRRRNWRWMWIHRGGLNAIDKMAVNMGSIWSRLWIRSRRQVSHSTFNVVISRTFHFILS